MHIDAYIGGIEAARACQGVQGGYKYSETRLYGKQASVNSWRNVILHFTRSRFQKLGPICAPSFCMDMSTTTRSVQLPPLIDLVRQLHSRVCHRRQICASALLVTGTAIPIRYCIPTAREDLCVQHLTAFLRTRSVLEYSLFMKGC
jgi:hypothetical protein